MFLLAVLGNGAVLFVSICTKSKMDVTRFLICNLACSDLCMGVYLGFLAIVDASTLGKIVCLFLFVLILYIPVNSFFSHVRKGFLG